MKVRLLSVLEMTTTITANLAQTRRFSSKIFFLTRTVYTSLSTPRDAQVQLSEIVFAG